MTNSLHRRLFLSALLLVCVAPGCLLVDAIEEVPLEEAEVVYLTTGSLVSEAGGSVDVSFSLSREPRSAVVVFVRVSDRDEALFSTGEVSETVTFLPSQWDIPQTLTVVGVDDAIADGDTSFMIEFDLTNSEDEDFDDLVIQPIELTNRDGVCGNDVVDGAEECEPPSDDPYCAVGVDGCEVCSTTCTSIPGLTNPDM